MRCDAVGAQLVCDNISGRGLAPFSLTQGFESAQRPAQNRELPIRGALL
jgi:hypothetical protein